MRNNKRRRFDLFRDEDVFGELDRSSTPKIEFFLPDINGSENAFGLNGSVNILSIFLSGTKEVEPKYKPPYTLPHKYRGYVEVKRGEMLLNLRNFYIELNRERLYGSRSPKESFNRWMMERKLHDNLNDPNLDPVLPSKEDLAISPLMYREISDDVPVKVNLFPRSLNELESSIHLFCEKSLYLCENNDEIGESLSPEQIDEIQENVEHIKNEVSETMNTGNKGGGEEIVPGLLEKFKTVRSVIVPLFQEKLKTIMEQICHDVEEKSLEYAAELRDLETKISKKDPSLLLSSQVDFAFLKERNGYRISSCEKSFFLNKIHFEKLEHLYRGLRIKNEEETVNNFKTDVFRLLCRYEFFFGDPEKEFSYEGSGHQGSIPPSAFKYLKEKFGVSMECFASPLNCYFPNFCSAFIDTDFLFGSVGSFFNFYPLEGSFEANPPFVEELMIRMVVRIEELIKEANRREKALSFFVIVPGWDDAESIQMLMGSEFARWKGELLPQEHCYLTGFQHKEKVNFMKQYYEAVHTSRIFFLQSNEGYKKWTPKEELVKGLISRFHKDKFLGQSSSSSSSFSQNRNFSRGGRFNNNMQRGRGRMFNRSRRRNY